MSNFGYGGLSFPGYPNQLRQMGLGGLSQNEINQHQAAASAAAASRADAQLQSAQQQAQQNNSNQGGQQATDNETKVKKERKNRPGQKFGAKKKSWVWSWFAQDSQDPNIAACDYCGRIITRLASDKGSPKKLSEHLKTHKLTRESINNTRPIPIDGHGNTYTQSGEPISIPNYSVNIPTPGGASNQGQGPSQGQPQSQAQASPQSQLSQQSQQGDLKSDDQLDENGTPKRRKRSKINKNSTPSAPLPNTNSNVDPNFQFNMPSQRRFLSADFDNTPYSPMKFHKHLMKFLTDNKLAINVIKSHSFQQLIYDLRTDSISDLLELTNLYSSLLEVSRFDGAQASSSDATDAISDSVVHTLNQELDKK